MSKHKLPTLFGEVETSINIAIEKAETLLSYTKEHHPGEEISA